MRRHWHDIARDVAIAVVCVTVAVFLAASYLNARRTANDTLNRVKAATSPNTQEQQAKAGARLVECATLRAYTFYYHTVHPTESFTFPAVDGCPPIPIQGTP